MAILALLLLLSAPLRAAELPHLTIDLALDPDAHRVSIEARSSAALPQPPDPGDGVQVESPDRTDPTAALVYSVRAPALAEALPHGTVSFIDTEGTLLFGGDWAPRIESGPYSYELRISAPATQRVVASGRLVEETFADGRYVARYVFDHPGRDLSIAAGPLVAEDATQGRVRVRTLFPPDLAASLGERYRTKAAGYLKRYSRRIGAYPGDIFQIVSSPAPVGLGFPTFTVLGRQILPLPFVPNRSLGHEVLHAWWGHGVAVAYETGNWSEALTTFMADYAFAEGEGETAARDMRYRWLADFAVLPAAELTPITAFREKRHTASQAIGYGKGAMVFFMLRDEIGGDGFDHGIRRFWQDWQFRRAGWDDLEASFAAASGTDLGWFFAQWLQRPDAPRLHLSEVVQKPGAIAFTLAQEDPLYRLRVPVALRHDGDTEARIAELDERERRFVWPVTAPVRELAVDPDYRVFRRLSPGEIAPTIRRLVVAEQPAAAALDPAFANAAQIALQRFFDGDAKPMEAGAAVAARRPLMLIGTRAEVADTLQRLHLPPRPSVPVCTGPGCAWAGHEADGVPLVAVEAETPETAERLITVLRHYGAESWIAWDGHRVAGRGLAAPPAAPLTVRLAP